MKNVRAYNEAWRIWYKLYQNCCNNLGWYPVSVDQPENAEEYHTVRELTEAIISDIQQDRTNKYLNHTGKSLKKFCLKLQDYIDADFN